jgi:hypothetical protein
MIGDRSRNIFVLLSTLGLLAGEFLSISELAVADDADRQQCVNLHKCNISSIGNITQSPETAVTKNFDRPHELSKETNSEIRRRSDLSICQSNNEFSGKNLQGNKVTTICEIERIESGNVHILRESTHDRINKSAVVNDNPKISPHDVAYNIPQYYFYKKKIILPICSNQLIKKIIPWKCR